MSEELGTRLVEGHVARLSSGISERSGEDSNLILGRMHRGESIEVLEPLFASDNTECAKSLIFVLSELGNRAFEAMDWLDVLLGHHDEFVRYYAVVSVWHSGSLVHGEMTAKVISKIVEGRPVAWAVVKFLAMGSLKQISTALPHLAGDLGAAVGWLADEDFDEWKRFSAHSEVIALVAVAGAYRLKFDQEDASALNALMGDRRKSVADVARFLAQFKPMPLKGRGILHRIARDESDG